ncbi:MAG: MBL fold metallo-hydrolase [Thermoanaerobaculaceae bacterium]|nr:MBL fold metallo-hydrolase [Thermoanaerobaculaceae bacterium]
MVKINVLSSGSSGNAVVIQSSKSSILIDDGVSFKKLKCLFEKEKLSIDKIDALVVSHEHSDHISGIRILLKKKPIPVFVSDLVAQDIEFPDDFDNMVNIVEAEEDFEIEDFIIKPFLVPHDAKQTFGFVIFCDGIKIGYAADLGTYNEHIVKRIKDSNCLMVEFNHDLDLLHNSPYPEHLKLRIASRIGHLSNDQGAKLLSKTISEETKAVYLMHLSKETNKKEYVEIAAYSALKEKDIFFEITNHLEPSRPFIF